MLKIITATVTLLYLISFSSSAALMKFSFQGVITGVENLFDKEYLASRNEGKLVGRERLYYGGITYNF